jgi:hypothetical protein
MYYFLKTLRYEILLVQFTTDNAVIAFYKLSGGLNYGNPTAYDRML